MMGVVSSRALAAKRRGLGSDLPTSVIAVVREEVCAVRARPREYHGWEGRSESSSPG